jgi:DNA modification methylase
MQKALVAADRTGRMCRRVEFDPLYFDVIVRRYEAARGRRALKYARSPSAGERGRSFCVVNA